MLYRELGRQYQITGILLLIDDDITAEQQLRGLRGEHFLDLEALHPLYLKLNVVLGEEVGEEGLLVEHPDQGAYGIIGIVRIALFRYYAEIALIETF